jgi:hypothetical protein
MYMFLRRVFRLQEHSSSSFEPQLHYKYHGRIRNLLAATSSHCTRFDWTGKQLVQCFTSKSHSCRYLGHSSRIQSLHAGHVGPDFQHPVPPSRTVEGTRAPSYPPHILHLLHHSRHLRDPLPSLAFPPAREILWTPARTGDELLPSLLHLKGKQRLHFQQLFIQYGDYVHTGRLILYPVRTARLTLQRFQSHRDSGCKCNEPHP